MENKLIVILGQTSSGKTGLSIKLAKALNGEIVSADSRQVYKGMDIGSGKVTKKEMQGIPHYLLDVANPKTRFTASQYQKLALGAIKDIQKRKKLAFLVGGTAFYINSIVNGIIIPEVKPNLKLRKELEKLSVLQMFEKLKKLDPERAKTIDKNNPRRLIRALEIVITTGNAVPQLTEKNNFNVLKIGILKTPEEIKKAIHKRLLDRLEKNALIDEVKKLRQTLSFKRLEEFGLEYRFVAQYLQNKITLEEMINKIEIDSWHLVKKQMTWFSARGGSAFGGKRIHWVKNYLEAKKLIKNFCN